LANEGAPTIFFKINTDICHYEPINPAEETIECIEVLMVKPPLENKFPKNCQKIILKTALNEYQTEALNTPKTAVL